MTDDEILKLFKTKDKKEYAFRQLVEKYREKIYRLIRRMVGDHDDTDDIMQDVFIKTWKQLEKFRGDSKLYTWLYRIAVNEALNFINKRKKKDTSPLEVVDFDADRNKTLGNELSGEEIQEKLNKAINILPDKQKVVFNLRYFEEMQYDEIAKVTGTSVGALKASYHHAAKKIEKFLFNND